MDCVRMVQLRSPQVEFLALRTYPVTFPGGFRMRELEPDDIDAQIFLIAKDKSIILKQKLQMIRISAITLF